MYMLLLWVRYKDRPLRGLLVCPRVLFQVSNSFPVLAPYLGIPRGPLSYGSFKGCCRLGPNFALVVKYRKEMYDIRRRIQSIGSSRYKNPKLKKKEEEKVQIYIHRRGKARRGEYHQLVYYWSKGYLSNKERSKSDGGGYSHSSIRHITFFNIQRKEFGISHF